MTTQTSHLTFLDSYLTSLKVRLFYTSLHIYGALVLQIKFFTFLSKFYCLLIKKMEKEGRTLQNMVGGV